MDYECQSLSKSINDQTILLMGHILLGVFLAYYKHRISIVEDTNVFVFCPFCMHLGEAFLGGTGLRRRVITGDESGKCL